MTTPRQDAAAAGLASAAAAAGLASAAAATTRRPARPDDFYRFRIPTDPRLSPDGRWIAFTVTISAPGHDGYRSTIWLVAADGSGPARQVTLGPRHDRSPRFSPDGRALAFLSDRREHVEEDPKAPKDREDLVQVHLLPLDGPGEARRVTNLPRGVDAFRWSPDGARLAVLSSSHRATREADARARRTHLRPRPGDPPEADYRYMDRLGYQHNGAGFIQGQEDQVWIVELADGSVRRLTDLAAGVGDLAWSPDGTKLAISTEPPTDRDLRHRSSVAVVDVETGLQAPVTGGADALFGTPVWTPDARTIVVLGGRVPEDEYRHGLWAFDPAGADAGPRGGRDLTSRHDVMPGSSVNSDTATGEAFRVAFDAAGTGGLFLAPHRGSNELWRVAIADGALERLTDGRHYISAFDAVGLPDGSTRIAAIRSAPDELPEVWVGDLASGAGSAGAGSVVLDAGSVVVGGSFDTSTIEGLRFASRTALNAEIAGELALVTPEERWFEVEGREIQGWFYPGGEGRQPLVLQIHGGPHTLYGWAPIWEWQVLAGAGIGVFACNPRGSEGYGRDFNMANLRDWGPGPMRDVLAGVDLLVAEGRAAQDRLGVTGGSYGGYLTNWIVAHDDRFRAAITCRSVVDMPLLFLTGDLGGGEWPKIEFGAYPWEDPELYREISPITHAHRIRTPLLIQHGERDLRTTIAQAEMLFSVLRRHRRPVRLMRVPDESHELTRSGTPFRRVENVVQIRDWFRHFLVDGERRLPPLPHARAGK